jgi:flagellar biosynthetic protein FliQ
MTPEMVMDLAYKGMRMSMVVAAPVLFVTLFVGLLVSLFQAGPRRSTNRPSRLSPRSSVCAWCW